MRLTKALGAAGTLIVAALVGGTLIGSTLAADETDGATDAATADGGTYCEAFLDALASELGVSRDDLTAAGQAAADNVIDAAVEAGDLPEERADALRERIAEYDGSGCGFFAKHPFGRGFERGFDRGVVHGFLAGDVFEAAADGLGLGSDELIGHLRDAGSLEAVAEAQGVDYDDLTASILAAVQADLDAAVAEGLSPARADAVIERLTAWLDEGGEVRPGGRPGFGPWREHLDGPWSGYDDAEEQTEAEEAAA